MRKDSTRHPGDQAPAAHIKNYITPAGLQRLKDERRFLLVKERPAVTQVVQWAASNGDRSENADYQYGKRRLRQIDSRIRFLSKRIEVAEVVDPRAPRSAESARRVFFGATVTYEDGERQEHVVTIVGQDEVGLHGHYVSWVSPLAKALMKARVGDKVVLRAPGGTKPLEIVDVSYREIPIEPFQEPPDAESAGRES